MGAGPEEDGENGCRQADIVPVGGMQPISPILTEVRRITRNADEPCRTLE